MIVQKHILHCKQWSAFFSPGFRARSLSRLRPQPKHVLAKTYDAIAEVYGLQDDFPNSAEWCEKGVQLLQEVYGPESLEVLPPPFAVGSACHCDSWCPRWKGGP